MTDPQPNIATLVAQLRETIDRRLVAAAFQPILDLKTGEVRAYEALTRTGPDSAFLNPGELFDAAERTGMLWDLELVTRRAVLEAAADWSAEVSLFLNCTPQVIADDRFAETLLAEVEAVGGLSPRRIVLEVTERSDNQHVGGLHKQAVILRRHGFHLAIDDVGAGTSGLNRIMLLRPDWLKLDRELVAGIDKDPVRTNLVRFLTHFAKLSGVGIIGEGVEREEELDRLIGLGVHCAQGFLIGRPGSRSASAAEDVAARVRDRGALRSGGDSDALSRIIRPGLTAETGWTVARAAEELAARPTEPGIALLREGLLMGWCSRPEIEQAVVAHLGSAEVGTLARPCDRTISSNAQIEEALEFSASHAVRDPFEPLFVTDGGRYAGLISTADLLRAAAHACRAAEHRVAPLTGLPGRVLSEERADASIRRRQVIDAAFIDLRGLAEYNAVFGFELGDELIRELVDVAAGVIRRRYPLPAETFLGHLGDDRLLALVPSGQTEHAAEEIIALFRERVSERGISPEAALSGLGVASASGTVSVRVLGIRNLAASCGSAREMLQAEPVLRAFADERAAMNPVSPGYVVFADENPEPEPVRLAA